MFQNQFYLKQYKTYSIKKPSNMTPINNVSDKAVDKLNALVPVLLHMKEEIDNVIMEIRILQSKVMPKGTRNIMDIITNVVCAYFQTTLVELRGKSRKAEVRGPRQILTTLLLEETKLSLESVGEYVGQNHATVIHSRKVVENAKQTCDQLWFQYKEIQTEVNRMIVNLDPIVSIERKVPTQ